MCLHALLAIPALSPPVRIVPLCFPSTVLSKDVEFTDDCVGPEVEKKVNAASGGQVCVPTVDASRWRS